MYLIFDTETTGLPKRWDAPVSDTDNWPRVVQIAWQLHDEMGNLIAHRHELIQPEGFDIPFESEQIHGISTALAKKEGAPLGEVLEAFKADMAKAKFIVGQNVGFDKNVAGAEFYRLGETDPFEGMPVLDTCTETTAALCKIPGGKGGRFKLPTLTELYEFLFRERFEEVHNASADVEATARCFFELLRRREGFTQKEWEAVTLATSPDYFVRFSEAHPQPVRLAGLKHINLKAASEKLREAQSATSVSETEIRENIKQLETADFVHLHNHTQFSILQATSNIKALVKATATAKMPAVALTDTANMMGAFHFVREINLHNKTAKARNEEAVAKGQSPEEVLIKPVIGCEFYVCENRKDRTRRDNGYRIVMLAKNRNGYRNLAKMASIAYIEGFYYVPRIDKEVVARYKDDIIVLTGNLYGEVPGKILTTGELQAEEALLWWKELFGDDLYIEVMRHGQEDEDRVNETLMKFSEKHRVKPVATNNTFYIHKEDANAHDILLCVKDGEKQATPIGQGRDKRYGLPNQEYYFKSGEEMKALFKDLPEAILNIEEILDKIVYYDLAHEVLLPKFEIPEAFQTGEEEASENNYLRHLTYEGAKRRYAEMTEDIRERIDFELGVIERTGYPGYFLIVQDFVAAARSMGVSVGPGRGSAAGSVVAYCLEITNIDPIANNLLFERFLNPDRVSLPDIDIDFDDEGRGKVIDYVIQKYGANQVAQIITYGTMAAKSSIRDTARVLDLPLGDADRIAKLIPPIVKLNHIFELEHGKLRERLRSEDMMKVEELKTIARGDTLEAQTINQARVLEGSLRNTGIHACGVIITPDDITNFVPIATAKDSELYVTQFDNAVVESAGLLKMDFLGLKTLTLIKDTVKLIKYRHNTELDADAFPLDDAKTYELFQRGETVGIFQYESPGMQKHMKELKPTVFADLVAMNALYRPGPLEYIPSFIRRKHGEEAITYDLPEMEEYLKETYGITVYQEQVMLLSQKLAGFTKGEADVLRKAMGKKIFALLQELKPKFLDGGEKKNHPREVLEKIWKDWEAFASYAFNKSHSTCYALIGYQTAYLKANYPEEYMAAVLSNNMNDIKQVTFFLEECRRMGIKVLGPDVNESFYKFTVNQDNAIRFGMGAVKGVGKGAVDTIVENRKEEKYTSVFDMAKRIDLRAANKKAFENLALAGGFDSFSGIHRAQYFYNNGEGVSFLEKALRFGAKYQENQNSAQVSLFGEHSDVQIPEPVVPECEAWSTMEKLRKEKEVVGIYISGHPLDDFETEIRYFCNGNISLFAETEKYVNREISFAGVVTDVQHRVSRNGKGWAIFTLEDYTDSFEFKIFGEEYLKFRHLLTIDAFIYAKVFIREGWTNNETGLKTDPRLQFSALKLLQDVMDNYARKLTIQLHINEVKAEKIAALQTLFKSHKGDHPLNFVIYEKEDNIKLYMPSRRKKIKISNELLTVLEKHRFHYKLN